MENVSIEWLQIAVTVLAALGLWLRLDSKINEVRQELHEVRQELKKDIQRVDDKIIKVDERVVKNWEASSQYQLETIERLTRVEEQVGYILRSQPQVSD